jgi:hypothetical protein
MRQKRCRDQRVMTVGEALDDTKLRSTFPAFRVLEHNGQVAVHESGVCHWRMTNIDPKAYDAQPIIFASAGVFEFVNEYSGLALAWPSCIAFAELRQGMS